MSRCCVFFILFIFFFLSPCRPVVTGTGSGHLTRLQGRADELNLLSLFTFQSPMPIDLFLIFCFLVVVFFLVNSFFVFLMFFYITPFVFIFYETQFSLDFFNEGCTYCMATLQLESLKGMCLKKQNKKSNNCSKKKEKEASRV